MPELPFDGVQYCLEGRGMCRGLRVFENGFAFMVGEVQLKRAAVDDIATNHPLNLISKGLRGSAISLNFDIIYNTDHFDSDLSFVLFPGVNT